jgi:cytochrome b6-f complex iron-sulfur subunit
MDDNSADTQRRSFLNWFLGGSISALAAATIYPIARFISPPRIPEASTNQVEAGPVNDPELLDRGFKIIRFGSLPVILVRVEEGDYRAFAATCTHLDCIVEYQKKESRIFCNCHNGEYDLTGRNVGGPPPKPLERFEVHVVPGKGSTPGMLVVARA